jgi:2-oxoglutarate ferredoxin oxidoreductase subunit alpha
MMENIGYAVMSETPCVFVDVQRGGPSTGTGTTVGQGDMMQCRWGSHGDYAIIALCPNSPQESFDLTIKAFNFAEKYRVPVMVMLDEVVGHMSEKVVIPPAEEIYIEPRRHTTKPPAEFKLFEPAADLVPDMVQVAEGYKIHITGLTHDERGYPAMTAAAQDRLVKRLKNKILKNIDDIVILDTDHCEDADVVVISYGITSRVAQRSIDMARDRGLKVGRLRLVTAWPFPEKQIRELAGKIKAFVVPELNLGQMVLEVERCAGGKCKTVLVPHAGGTVHDPDDILKAIEEAIR